MPPRARKLAKPYRDRLALRAERYHRNGFSRLLPDRCRLYPVVQGQGHSRGAGPWFRRGLGGGLGTDDYRPRPAEIRACCSSASSTRNVCPCLTFDIDFLPGPPRRGDPLRAGKIRPSITVAQIITFGKLQARAVLRDVGRVLGMPYGLVDKISKLVPFNPAHPPYAAAKPSTASPKPASHARQ